MTSESCRKHNLMPNPYRVLSIGGSDSSGSAGIQADLKTFEACGVFGSTALTMVTAQDTEGVKKAFPLPEDFIAQQIETVLDDLGADAVKTGVLGRKAVVQVVAEHIQAYAIDKLVVDPVLVDGRGRQFVDDATLDAYRRVLFPLAMVITPNLDEAALLTGVSIENAEDIAEAARRLHGCGAQVVVVKGGHLAERDRVIDLVYDGYDLLTFVAPRLPVDNPHGVGCTFASAMAAELAKGNTPQQALETAHRYLHAALRGSLGWRLGRGRAAVYHATNRDPVG